MMRVVFVSLFLGTLLLSAYSIAAGELPIAHLVFRDFIVTVMSSEEGPLYTVLAKDGSNLDTELNSEELLSLYPELHQKLESAVAGSTSQSFIWAGNSLPTRSNMPISVSEFLDRE